MSSRSIFTGALFLLMPALAVAQAPAAPSETWPQVTVFANGGGASPLTNLNELGTADFKTGWTAGGGVGVQLNRYLAVRGVFDYARNKGDDISSAYAGQSFNRYFYGADIQLRYPTKSGFAPYLLGGAGAVTIDNKDDPTFNQFTNFAGKVGAGVEYAFPNNGFGVFAQGASYIYEFDHGGFDKTQTDLLWTAGLSYRFRL
ncbi:MAG TPA: outer membrane beta-barrel protein [Gemmatimonadales bacterium]|nr:outer membrane beta-barrel protein [Gemmatimonadales bacterium]